MPVTFNVASHAAAEIKLWGGGGDANPDTILRKACEPQSRQCDKILQSSVHEEDLRKLRPNSNGFVHAVLEAYGTHYHLVIRPDDVWLAILVQLSFYVNAHAEELRSYFVSHEGKKQLKIKTVGDRYSVNYGAIARQFTALIHKSVVDSTLVEWILPDFTTTTMKDKTICSVVTMSTLKAYFDYRIDITCGIPSVTLEGEKSDWEEIYRRLHRLYDFGDEPSVWAEMLRPIIRRFIDAFDGEPDVEFWKHVAYRSQEICGQDDLSGWITAFCVWSNKGVWMPEDLPNVIPQKPEVPPPRAFKATAQEASGCMALPRVLLAKALPAWLRKYSRRGDRGSPHGPHLAGLEVKEKMNASAPDAAGLSAAWAESRKGSIMERGSYGRNKYTLDGVPYFVIAVGSVPAGYCEVDVLVVDNGVKLDCTMLSGHVAFSVSSKVPEGALNTVSPSPQWFIFQKKGNFKEAASNEDWNFDS